MYNRHFCLSHNPISDTGARQLVALPKLKMLNLYGTNITESGIRALMEMPSLKNLYVWQTKVDTLRMDSFKLPRKDLEIVYKLGSR